MSYDAETQRILEAIMPAISEVVNDKLILEVTHKVANQMEAIYWPRVENMAWRAMTTDAKRVELAKYVIEETSGSFTGEQRNEAARVVFEAMRREVSKA